MRIKICGITRLEDAHFCASVGVDFLGLNFVKSSPRCIDEQTAAEIVSTTRNVRFVGVFRDEPIENILRIAKLVGLDYIQLHGSETEDDVRAIGMPVIKAFCVERALPDTNTNAEWLMFDSGGGTGRTFDWSLLARHPRTKPFFLAGGLRPENVAEAIRIVRPDAIDVAGGVERAPGIKDHAKIQQLMERAR